MGESTIYYDKFSVVDKTNNITYNSNGGTVTAENQLKAVDTDILIDPVGKACSGIRGQVKYSTVFDYNGGTCNGNTSSSNSNDVIFINWNTKPDGTGTFYGYSVNNTIYKKNEDLILYAIYSYKIQKELPAQRV